MLDHHLLHDSLITGAVLLAVGTVGFLARRSPVVMLLSISAMIAGIVLTLAGFGHFHGDPGGSVFALFVLTVAGIEAGIGLAVMNDER